MTQTSSYFSPHYASPEQINEEPSGAATDIYALTAVLYQCLSGQPPFSRSTGLALARAHVEDPPPTFDGLPVEAAKLNHVIARGMAKDPSARYARATDMLDEAGNALAAIPLWRRKKVPAFPPRTDADLGSEATISRSALWGPPSGAVREDGGTSEVIASETIHRSALVLPDPVAAVSGPELTETEAVGAEPSVLPGLPEPTPSAAGSMGAAEPHRVEPVKHRPNRRMVGGGIALVVVAAVAAVIATSGGTSQHRVPRPVVASAGSLAISYTPPWHKGHATPLEAAVLSSPDIAITNGSVDLAAGTLKGSAATPGGAPPGLVSSLGNPTQQASVTVAGHPGVAYAWSGVTAYVAPTTAGDLTVICAGATHSAKPCADLAAAATESSVTSMAPGPDTALQAAVDGALRTAATLDKRLGKLTQATLADRAARATALALAEFAAARSLGSAVPPARYSALVSGLAGALRAEGNDLKKLAAAGRAGSVGYYNAARGPVHAASLALLAALSPFDSAGLTTPGFPKITLDAPPKPVARVVASTPATAYVAPPAQSQPQSATPLGNASAPRS